MVLVVDLYVIKGWVFIIGGGRQPLSALLVFYPGFSPSNKGREDK